MDAPNNSQIFLILPLEIVAACCLPEDLLSFCLSRKNIWKNRNDLARISIFRMYNMCITQYTQDQFQRRNKIALHDDYLFRVHVALFSPKMLHTLDRLLSLDYIAKYIPSHSSRSFECFPNIVVPTPDDCNPFGMLMNLAEITVSCRNDDSFDEIGYTRPANVTPSFEYTIIQERNKILSYYTGNYSKITIYVDTKFTTTMRDYNIRCRDQEIIKDAEHLYTHTFVGNRDAYGKYEKRKGSDLDCCTGKRPITVFDDGYNIEFLYLVDSFEEECDITLFTKYYYLHCVVNRYQKSVKTLEKIGLCAQSLQSIDVNENILLNCK